MLPTILAFAVATACAPLTLARVSILNPLASQLPPVARVGKPFEWIISQYTFVANNSVRYTSGSLPHWLSFDPSTRTFRGIPALEDKGTFDIAITANDSSDSETSKVKILVTDAVGPILAQPISSQFHASNPSLSSVFLLHSGSALNTPDPTLRIPAEWSFSIGFEGSTFQAVDNLYYYGLQADGSALPPWIKFSSDDITFHGFTPRLRKGESPLVVSLALHASDFEGYTATALPFCIVIASKELSILSSSLPTINLITSTPFDISLTSPANFQGVLVDNAALQPSDLLSIDLDVSQHKSWLTFEKPTRTLRGTPPAEILIGNSNITIPVILTALDHQQLRTNVSLVVVPSYFSTNYMDPISATYGQDIQFNLSRYVINYDTNSNTVEEVEFSAEFAPTSARQFLTFNPSNMELSGVVPKDSRMDEINATFTAFSKVTNSISHANLRLAITPERNDVGQPLKHYHSHKSKIFLALQVACGVTGGLLLLAIMLAVFRRYARVEDTALEGEEGRRAWSEDEKKYYGFVEPIADSSISPFVPPSYVSRPEKSNGNTPQSPRNVSKAEFLSRLRSTVRTVSDRCRARPQAARLVISRPMPFNSNEVHSRSPTEENSLDAGNPTSYSSSSDTDSSRRFSNEVVAQRRADFAAPRVPPRAASDWRKHRTASMDSSKSLAGTLTSVQNHESEAVVQTASRARSVRSERSVNRLSYVSFSGPSPTGRPRLVPFTYSARVPEPDGIPPVPPVNTSTDAPWAACRVPSQRAKVVSADNATSEDWSLGMQYMRALGEDDTSSDKSNSSLPIVGLPITDKQTFRYSSGSFSLASSKYTMTRHVPGTVPRIVVRTDERFTFRVPLATNEATELSARLLSGNPLPKLMAVQVEKGLLAAEVQGVPRRGDEGEVRLGIFDTATGECLGQVIIEVVLRV